MRFQPDITNLAYSTKELKQCVRNTDFYNLGAVKSTLDDDIAAGAQSFYDGGLATGPLRRSEVRERNLYSPLGFIDTLCVRRTDQILRHAFKTNILNREHEVYQLLQILLSPAQLFVFKTDIQSFFESVKFSDVIKQIQDEGLRNSSVIKHLTSINQHLLSVHSYPGLPRGLALSSTLADYYLRSFDTIWLRRKSVVYYTRYVDDICIIHFDDHQQIKATVENSLKSIGLDLNFRKTRHLPIEVPHHLDFLGYRISLGTPQCVSIAPSKISKTKKRIALSLKDYLKTNDFDLLAQRLKFLSTLCSLHKADRQKRVYSGIKINYKHCTPVEIGKQLNELDSYLKGLLYSKRYTLSRSLRSRMSSAELAFLDKLSFTRSFDNHIVYSISQTRMSHIRKAWQYE